MQMKALMGLGTQDNHINSFVLTDIEDTRKKVSLFDQDFTVGGSP
jgi:hypothetical protein